MGNEKPQSIDKYKEWMREEFKIDIRKEETRYKDVTLRMSIDFHASTFWGIITKSLPEYHDEYFIRTGYPLFHQREYQPILVIKPFESFISKTYKKNILVNRNWPKEPQDGWILPINWYSRINDIIRTLIEVKYLDGVTYMIGKIKCFCNVQNANCETHLEARDDGYYAGHLYITQSFEIPRINWDTERINSSVEIQITTQLQEIIRKLLHKYYEEKKYAVTRDSDTSEWKWNYKSDEFSTAYLGHILHYVEGMIMEIRDRQINKEKIR